MGNMSKGFGLAIITSLALASPAAAGVPHVVQPGETLWTIANANGFTTHALAVSNGLSDDSNVVLGSTIQIPSVAEASQALANAGITGSSGSSSTTTATAAPAAAAEGGYAVQPGDTLSGIAAAHGVSLAALAAANGVSPDSFAIAGTTIKIPSESATGAPSATSSAGPPPLGGYEVRPGDSLSGIAATAGVPMQQIAWMNGLDPSHVLLAGTVLKLPTGAQAPSSSAPAPAQAVVPQAAPNPTPERVSSSEIAQIAAANGVPASMASAIAWQESGFNNAMVSGANARGVMQIMPGTWDGSSPFIQANCCTETPAVAAMPESESPGRTS